jgi:cyanophycinase-like exopeptidase
LFVADRAVVRRVAGRMSRMRQASGCRVLAVIGSGETSPTMVTVHKDLVSRLGIRDPAAVLIEDPYAFQENAEDVSARAASYFARSVGLTVTVVRSAGRAGDAGTSGPEARVRDADWVFAGPGSPSYALGRWLDGPVGRALAERVAAGAGVTVLASAAAATIGFAAVPVYEVYKAGTAPHWLDGLDLMGELGLKVAVIPHFDNTEGGRYDTRYCYLGEQRLAAMERELPADAAVLGVDEHTAALFDLRSGSVEVAGRGAVTVRRGGTTAVLPAGTTTTLAGLRDLVAGRASVERSGSATARRPAAAAPGAERPPAPRPLPEVTAAARRRFDAADQAGDARGMVAAILDLEEAVHAWAADTEEDEGTPQARAALRGFIARLGKAAERGPGLPGDSLQSMVRPLLELRSALRHQGRYETADAIRAALAAAGLEVRDDPGGTHWVRRD